MADELRRTRAAVRNRIEQLAGRRTPTTGGAGAWPMGIGLGDLDVIAIETGGEVTEIGGTVVNAMAVETCGEVV